MDLELEKQTYERELPTLLLKIRESATAPRFVLIHGAHVDSMWDTQMDAVRAGYRFFGQRPFLVKMVEAGRRTALSYSGVLGPCQS